MELGKTLAFRQKAVAGTLLRGGFNGAMRAELGHNGQRRVGKDLVFLCLELVGSLLEEGCGGRPWAGDTGGSGW